MGVGGYGWTGHTHFMVGPGRGPTIKQNIPKFSSILCYSAYLLCLRTTSSQDGFEEVIIHKGLLIALNASHYYLIRQDQRVTCADKVAFLALEVCYLFCGVVMAFSHLYIKLPQSACCDFVFRINKH